MGESEKLVKTLFKLAYEREPSVIFIDEIDSIMGVRGGNEHEASRRLKTEFLVQFDGVNSNTDKRVLVLAATNRPEDLDEACLRRLTRRIYMPLPDKAARLALIKSKVSDAKIMKHSFTEEDLDSIATLTEGYSMADLTIVIKDMAMMPIREIP
jgi:spastin